MADRSRPRSSPWGRPGRVTPPGPSADEGTGTPPLSEAPTTTAAGTTGPVVPPTDPASPGPSVEPSPVGPPPAQPSRVEPPPAGPSQVGPSLAKPGDPPTPPVTTASVATPPPTATPPSTHPGVVGAATPTGPAPGRRRRSRGTGLLIGLLVVAVVVLTAGIAFLAWGGSDSGDGDDTAADERNDAATETTTGDTDDAGEGLAPPASDQDDGAGSTDGDQPSDGEPGPSDATDPGSTTPDAGVPAGGDPFLPGVGPMPEGLPTPPGGVVTELGFVEVPGSTVEEVRDFYVAELPAAGFTAGEPQGSSGSWVVPVTGEGVAGNLTITDVTGTATVVWLPT